MRLSLLHGYPSQLVKVGKALCCNFESIGFGAIPETINREDPMLRTLGYDFHVPIGYHNFGAIFGARGFDNLKEDVIHFKPKSFRSRQDSYDVDEYGGFYQNIRLAGDVLSGHKTALPSSVHESFVRHTGYSGGLVTKSSERPSYVTSVLLAPYFVWVPDVKHLGHPQYGVGFLGGHLDRLDSTRLVSTEFGWPYHSLDVTTLFDSLTRSKGAGSFLTSIYGDINVGRKTISDTSWNIVGDQLVLTYRMAIEVYPLWLNSYVGSIRSWTSTLRFPVGMPECNVDATAYPDGLYFVQDPTPPSYSYVVDQWSTHETDMLGAGTATRLGSVPPGTPWSALAFALSNPEDSEYRSDILRSSVPSTIKNSQLLENFEGFVGKQWHDVSSSALQSAVAAFKQAEGNLGPNVLQDLKDLPGMAESLPKVTEAVKVISAVLHRKFDILTIREILSLLSETELQASFEWVPDVGLVRDYLPKVASTLQRVLTKRDRVVGYGSFHYDFPTGSFGRTSASLLTKTKIVIDGSAFALSSAVLGLDVFGVLPKPSNLLDLVPFSFVANWFTGYARALRNAEYSLSMATIPCYYVHTYTITSPLTDKEVENWNYQPSALDPPVLKLYYRDVSLYSPMPRDSVFGFGLPTQLPPLALMGSLLYQLIFA